MGCRLVIDPKVRELIRLILLDKPEVYLSKFADFLPFPNEGQQLDVNLDPPLRPTARV